MNDITKARYFLKTKGSKLKDLTSFGLMLATAESNYRDVRLRRVGAPGNRQEIDPIEVNALVDYAVLRYLKKYNQLPEDAGVVVQEGATWEDKRDAAVRWLVMV